LKNNDIEPHKALGVQQIVIANAAKQDQAVSIIGDECSSN
jgi:hypothetical protein